LAVRGASAGDRIRAFLEANVGRVVTTQEIREVAGISEYAGRIRELRDLEGMQISSHKDRHDLKPGEYILETSERRTTFGAAVSIQLRNEILERNGYTCQNCGAGPGDPDPFNPSRKVSLHIDHVTPLSQGGNQREGQPAGPLFDLQPEQGQSSARQRGCAKHPRKNPTSTKAGSKRDLRGPETVFRGLGSLPRAYQRGDVYGYSSAYFGPNSA